MEKTDAEYIAELERLFRSNAGLGSLGSPRKGGFLAIAKLGKEYWNAWRKARPGATADFSGQGSSSFTGIDFSGFEFPTIEGQRCADFSGAHLGPEQKFANARFGDEANFVGTTFSGDADFSDAKFGDGADFSESGFKGKAVFKGCRFGAGLKFAPASVAGEATFGGTGGSEQAPTFGNDTTFGDFAFTGNVDFVDVTFSGLMHFSSTKFQRRATFKSCHFQGEAEFINATFTETEFADATFHQKCSFKDSCFNGDTSFTATVFVDKVDFTGKEDNGKKPSFASIRFSGCWFAKGATFRDREFKTTALFGKAPGTGRDLKKVGELLGSKTRPHHADKTVFLGIPDFHGCKFHQDTSFVGTEFEVPPGDAAARAFCTLKQAMEGLKSIHQEQMFFRKEMEAERENLTGPKKIASYIYDKSSDYGGSLLRPLVLLALGTTFFGFVHGALINWNRADTILPSLTDIDTQTTWKWVQYVLINTFPVPGFDKTQSELRIALFGTNQGTAAIATAVEMLHKVVSLGCVFLVGLALRNLFKMKS